MLTAWITVLVCVIGGLSVVWAVLQVARGRRDAVVTVLAVILLSVMATVLVIGQPGHHFGILELALWPFMLWGWAWDAVGLHLWLVVGGVPVLFAATLLAAYGTRNVRLWVICAGTILSFILPIAAQSWAVMRAMETEAEDTSLRIVETHGLFHAIRNAQGGYREPHGLACGEDGWPYLWSYQTRSWDRLPDDSRFGGPTPALVAQVCEG